jgi:hypothetical protein
VHRLATAAVALLLAAPAHARDPYRPCAHAASIVARDLAPGAGPTGLAGRPLYELELTVRHHQGFQVEGREQVSFAAPDGRRAVILTLPAPAHPGGHAPLRVSAVSAVVGPGNPTPAPFSRGRGRITVTLPRAPSRGERVAVRLHLAGRLPSAAGGIAEALQGYLKGDALGGTLVAGDDAAALISPEALLTLRRHGAPWVIPEAAFGAPSPAPVACHLVTVDAPAELTAVASGAVVGTVPEKGHRVRHVFVSAGRRVGVVLAPRGQARVERKAGPVTITGIAPDRRTATELAADAAAAVNVLADRLGPLPWSHLSVVLGPVAGPLAGARVGGLVVVSSNVDTDTGGLMGLSGAGPTLPPLAVVVTHQVAHQWFGELVATPGPAAPVVEELLAQGATLQVIGVRHGAAARAQARQTFLGGGYSVYRSLGGVDGPADRPARALRTVAAWAGLCAAKAPGVFGALAGELGQATVDQAVDRLAKENRFGVVRRRDLAGSLFAAAPTRIKATRRTLARWLDEAHGDADLGGPNATIQALLQAFPGMTGAPGSGSSPAMPDAAQMQRMQQLMQKMMQQMLKQLQNGGP